MAYLKSLLRNLHHPMLVSSRSPNQEMYQYFGDPLRLLYYIHGIWKVVRAGSSYFLVVHWHSWFTQNTASANTNNRLTFEAYCDGILMWAIILTLILPCTLANLTQISLPPRQLPLFLYLVQLPRCKTKVLTGGNSILSLLAFVFSLIFSFFTCPHNFFQVTDQTMLSSASNLIL